MPKTKLTRIRTAKLTLSPGRRRIMRRRVLDKVSGGFSHMDALAKVISKHQITGGDMLALTRDVFRLAVRRRQLTRKKARSIMAEVLGTGR